jgi:hypothetical protein
MKSALAMADTCMIRAAGIIFVTPDRKALFLKRSRSGDAPDPHRRRGRRLHDVQADGAIDLDTGA